MKNYKVNLNILAIDKEQVAEKLQAFQDLQDHLQHEDFIQSVDIIVENPDIIPFIKEVMPTQDKELSLTDYIRIARKAFTKFGN